MKIYKKKSARVRVCRRRCTTRLDDYDNITRHQIVSNAEAGIK